MMEISSKICTYLELIRISGETCNHMYTAQLQLDSVAQCPWLGLKIYVMSTRNFHFDKPFNI